MRIDEMITDALLKMSKDEKYQLQLIVLGSNKHDADFKLNALWGIQTNTVPVVMTPSEELDLYKMIKGEVVCTCETSRIEVWSILAALTGVGILIGTLLGKFLFSR